MAAAVHYVLDQTLDRLVLAWFSFETLAKRVNDHIGERLTGTLRQRSRQPIGVRVFDAQGHSYLISRQFWLADFGLTVGFVLPKIYL